jgi:FkbM family methyltransferase
MYRLTLSTGFITIRSAWSLYMILWQIRHHAKTLFDSKYREINRLLRLPRKQFGTTNLLGPELSFVDGRTCALQYKVIFESHIYAMNRRNPAPRILDVGANIGMATIYFKKCFADARIDAFEADPQITNILRRNVDAFDLTNVTIHNVAASNKIAELEFVSDGSDGGRLIDSEELATSTMESAPRFSVPAVRLKDWLSEPIDLLKIDIEGAEYDVIADCKDDLRLVRQIFVEYHSFSSRPQVIPEFLGMLRDAGFRLYVQTDYCAPSPLKEPLCDGEMDLRLNIFATQTRSTEDSNDR